MSAGFDGSKGIHEGNEAVIPDSGATSEAAAEDQWAGVIRDEIQWFGDRDKLIKFDKNNDGQLSRKEIRAYTLDFEKRSLSDKESLTWQFNQLLDGDGNGVLSKSEQERTLSYLIKDTPLGQIDFSTAKADASGSVSLDEFLKAAASMSTMRNAHKTSKAYADVLIDLYDSNSNGRLEFPVLSAHDRPPGATEPKPGPIPDSSPYARDAFDARAMRPGEKQ